MSQGSHRSSDSELGRAARGGLVTLIGAGLSSVFGFVLSIVLARLLGASGAGVVYQAIAAFTIALSLTRLGLDTTAVWLLPRLMNDERHLLRQAVVAMILPALLGPVVAAGSWYAYVALRGPEAGDVVLAISAVAPFLAAASLMTVALAATRAFGGVVPFNVIGNIAVPGLRPLLVWAVVAVGGSATAVTLAWGVPWAIGLVAALAVLGWQVRRQTSSIGGDWLPTRRMLRRIFGFSLPRTLAAGLDQAIIWLDVLIVGAIAGAAAAGVYGAAARFVGAGLVVATAMRIVVAPRFSSLLGKRDSRAVSELYGVTARWILVFGSPAYLVLAAFAPTVLSWLGPGFGGGRTTLVILCVGSIVVLAAGNVQALLLMSGRSAASAVNKLVVVAFNVLGNIVLVPRIGIEGAALTWVASMALDTSLAAWQVRRALGVSLQVLSILRVAAFAFVSVGAPSLAVAWLLGQGLGSLALGIALSGVCLLVYCYLDRRHLRLGELRHLRR